MRGGRGTGRCNARAANVPCARAACSNADEGGERRAARAQGSFAALESSALCPCHLLRLDYKLLSQALSYTYMNNSLSPVKYYLVYIDCSLFGKVNNEGV